MDLVQDADLTWLIAIILVFLLSPLWEKLNQWLTKLNEPAEPNQV